MAAIIEFSLPTEEFALQETLSAHPEAQTEMMNGSSSDIAEKQSLYYQARPIILLLIFIENILYVVKVMNRTSSNGSREPPEGPEAHNAACSNQASATIADL